MRALLINQTFVVENDSLPDYTDKLCISVNGIALSYDCIVDDYHTPCRLLRIRVAGKGKFGQTLLHIEWQVLPVFQPAVSIRLGRLLFAGGAENHFFYSCGTQFGDSWGTC